MSLDTPIVLILFNRPGPTARAFDAIRAARPARLLLVADGPRHAGERALTDAARAVVANVDWDCHVLTRYSAVNLGCRRNVAEGIDWALEHVDRAIFLEDDCVPHPTFFRFCDELLRRYADDPRVSMISGDNFQPPGAAPAGNASYYFSAIAHVWGWATWRRAWRGWFDIDMPTWPMDRDSDWLAKLLRDDRVRATYRRAFDAVYERRVDTWDAQWQLGVWRSRGWVALPKVNLVSNIGFGHDATHTRLSDSPDANLPTHAMDFPLVHPDRIERDASADLTTWRRSMERGTIA